MTGDGDLPRVQRLLLRGYAAACGIGLLDRPWVARGVEWGYLCYKRFYEAPAARHLRALIPPGAYVMDVGANIGFYTDYFARWVHCGGRVLALEPEARNLRRLRSRLREAIADGRVEVLPVAVSDHVGSGSLRINPFHPGDHVLTVASGKGAVEVETQTIDALMEARSWPSLALVKLDIQGAELHALRGARETIRRCRPAWLIELDPRLMEERFGVRVDALLRMMGGCGYRIFRLTRKGIAGPIEVGQVLRVLSRRRYEDLLFR